VASTRYILAPTIPTVPTSDVRRCAWRQVHYVRPAVPRDFECYIRSRICQWIATSTAINSSYWWLLKQNSDREDSTHSPRRTQVSWWTPVQ